MRPSLVILIGMFSVTALHAQDGGDQCQAHGSGSQKLKDCLVKSCQAEKDCTAAAKDAIGKSDAQAGATGAKYTGSGGQAISEPGKDSSLVQSQGAAFLQGAIKQCTANRKTCEEVCDSKQAEQNEKSQMDQAKQDCFKNIDGKLASLGKGKGDNTGASKGSDKTGDQAGGMPPMSPPQSGDDKNDDSKTNTADAGSTGSTSTPTSSAAATPAAQPQSAAVGTASVKGCGTVDTATSLACVSDMKTACATAKSDACDAFNSAYCSANSGSSPMTGSNDFKAGAGLSDSDNYCSNRQMAAWCSSHSGCSQCGGSSTSGDCGVSPASLPTLNSNGSALASSGGGGGSGSASSGGMATASVGSTGSGAAVKEDPLGKLAKSILDGSAGGGGGSGGTDSGGSGDSSNGAFDAMNLNGLLGRAPAKAAPVATDAELKAKGIEVTAVPNALFRITEEVISARCAAGKENNCPPRK